MADMYDPPDDDPQGGFFRKVAVKAKESLLAFKDEMVGTIERAFEMPILRQIKQIGQRIGGNVSAVDKAVTQGHRGIEAASQSADWAARNTNVARNADLSSTLKGQALADSLPVVGGLIRSLRGLKDALDGTTERMRQDAIRHSDRMLSIGLATSNALQTIPQRQQLYSAQAQAVALGGARASAYSPSDRSTAAGMVNYQEEQQRLASRDTVDAARRHAEAARQAANDPRVGSRLAGIDAEMASARGRKGVLGRESGAIERRSVDVTSSKDQADLLSNLRERAEINQRLIGLEQQRRSIQQGSDQAAMSAAQAESQYRKANIQLLQTELQILQQREQRMSTSAQSLAQMTPFQRQFGLEAARAVRDNGIDNATFEQRDAARRFAPGFMGREEERYGEGTEEYGALRDEFGEFGDAARGRSIAETREQQAVVQAEVRNNIVLDEGMLAQEIARVLGPALERMIASLTSEATFREIEARINRSIAINSGGAP